MNLKHLLSPTQQSAALASLPLDLAAQVCKPLIQIRSDRYITKHPQTLHMLSSARMIAPRPEPVLITGESGTGKEIIARLMLFRIDSYGKMEALPESSFFPVNCAGLVDTLFESLLFGHKAGSFTGASRDKAGIISTAGHGVVFFDEIGELPLNQQAKLLRVLQERRIMPVGSDYEIPIKCRFVFATNRDLVAEVTAGRFREDLYYRICAITLQTYPLRERGDDALLIAHTLTLPDDPELTSVPDHILQSRGNVRALENWILQRRIFDIGRDGINPAVGENIEV